MIPVRKLLNESMEEMRGNRKLQVGVVAIALLVCVEGGANWADSLAVKEGQLQQLRAQQRNLRNQSRDEGALRRQSTELEEAQRLIEKRLWVVSSEAVGQAQLKDWLAGLGKKVGAKNYSLVLSSPRAVNAAEGRTALSADSRAGSSGAASEGPTKGLREFRANITMVFAPASLESTLLELEGGETLAMVESLYVNRRDRKVEIGVRVLMMIGQSGTPSAPLVERAEDSSLPAANNSFSPKEGAMRPGEGRAFPMSDPRAAVTGQEPLQSGANPSPLSVPLDRAGKHTSGGVSEDGR